MAAFISFSSPQLQSLNTSSNFSSSRNFLYIRSQKKLDNLSGGKNHQQKQSSGRQNASRRFAELKAVNVHRSHKNTTSNTPQNHRQTAHENEGERQTRTNTHKIPNPENEENSKLNNRASTEPSVRGEDVLLALQRLSLEKAKEKSRKSKQKAASTKKGGKGLQDAMKEKKRVIAEVRPITVKPHWSAQIESLEKRFNELKERADIT